MEKAFTVAEQFDDFVLRVGELYPEDIALSIQGSRTHYCSPRTVLDDLRDYERVEIALMDGKKSGRNKLVTASDLGIEGFGDIWENDSVGPYVPWERVDALRAALKAKYGDPLN